MNKFVKMVGIGLLVAGLAACDDKSSEALTADNSATAAQQNTQVSLLKGHLSFTVPAGMGDQNGKSEVQTSNMTVYGDDAGQRSMIIIISEGMAEPLATLVDRMEDRQKKRDASLKVLSKSEIEIKSKMIQRLDTITKIEGRDVYMSTLMGKLDDELITIQLSYPADTQEQSEKAVQAFIDSLILE